MNYISRILKIILLSISIMFITSCKNNVKTIKAIEPAIIPAPNTMDLGNGVFLLTQNTSFKYDALLKPAADLLKTYIEKGANIVLNEQKNNTSIEFKKEETITNEEDYELIVTPNKITILAKNLIGAFLGVQTLRQLLPPCFENGSCDGNIFELKAVVIKDAPEFKYRGMHLDVGRHFFSVDFIKKYIDNLAMLKMNTFHWHLTEDQGWRIEIKKYPKLTSHAGFRKETLIGHYNDQPHQFDKKEYGGFYTQEEIKDVVKYASSRGVTIIPEIELPGHSQAAVSAYPELGCTGKQVDVATKWGVFEEIYCPKESTFTFLENVLDEVVDLFPGKYIHIGGDEAPKIRWKECSHCQELMKKEGIKDEHELQSYFINRIEKYLNNKNKQIIGWDEILEGGLAPNATVMSWRGNKGAIKAAKEQHDVILTPNSHCYFDHYQSDNENEPLAIGGFLPLEKVYHFNPVPEELTKEEAKYVLGAQGNVWTEYMKTSNKVEYMVFPRMIALSEAIWSKKEHKDYNNFLKRLKLFHKRLDALDINYANHLYDIKGTLKTNKDKSLRYALNTTFDDSKIHYTTNGDKPSSSSPVYNSPIQINQNTTIRAQVYSLEKELGNEFTETINLHNAVASNITVNVLPHKAYNTGGKKALINGISGSNKRYGDSEWLGFWGEDLEINIDLNNVKSITNIETRFFNAKGQWIYAPKELSFEFSNDNITYTKLQKSKIKSSEDNIVNNNTHFTNIKARFLKIKVTKYGKIPEGFQGAGNQAWTFIDEIKVW